MCKFTPGPWKINYKRVTPVNGKQDGTDDICHVYGDEEKEIANAKLIALAPEMYKLICDVINYTDEFYLLEDIKKRINKFISIIENDSI